MKIGIISDLHNNLRHLDVVRAEMLNTNVEMVIFCGDFDMPFSMRGFIEFKLPIVAVLGNGDPDIQKFLYQLQNLEDLKNLDFQLNFRFQDLVLDGCRIGVTHGDEEVLVKSLIESQLYDLLCLGHSHRPSVSREKKTLVVNPGSLVGWLYEVPGHNVPVTYAIFDTKDKSAIILEAKV